MSGRGPGGEDVIGEWSQEKLNLLEKYLGAYTTIMDKQKKNNGWLRKFYYIDAFAGAVEAISKEEQEYIEGSPLRALRTQPKFDEFIFIDVNPQRIEKLNNLKASFPDNRIDIRQGDCNEVLRNQVYKEITFQSYQRGMVFLDPYGMEIEFATIEDLAKTKAIDIFVNFSVMGVTRLLPKKNIPSNQARGRISKFMGKTDWIDETYREPDAIQLSLLGETSSEQYRDTIKAENMAEIYASQLSTIFRYVSNFCMMRNSTNSAIYALFLASHNETAIKIMNQIFSQSEW
jgi:three-Cys-motif partner protein